MIIVKIFCGNADCSDVGRIISQIEFGENDVDEATSFADAFGPDMAREDEFCATCGVCGSAELEWENESNG